MKNLLSICFLLLTQYSFAQTTLFNKSIELNPDVQHEGFTTVLVNQQGDIYGIGKTTNRYEMNKDSLVVVKMSKTGVYKWLRRYDVKAITNELIKESVLLPDGSLVLGGTLQYYTTLNQNAFLLKLDSLGNEIWYQEYGISSSYYQSIYDVKVTKDGGFIFGRRTDEPPVNGAEDAWLVKTDSLGNVEWEQQFGNTANNSVIRILVNENDTYTTLISNSTTQDSYATIYTIAADGSILSFDTYNESFPYINYGGFWDTEGSTLTLGMRPVENDNLLNFDGYISKIDSNGVAWNLVITEGIWTQEWFYKGVELPDGNYMIAGSSNYNQLGSDTFRGWLVKVSKEGTLLWSKILQHDEDNLAEYFEDIALSPDSTVVIIGTTRQLSEEGQLGTLRNNMWVLKVDYEGNSWLPLTVEATISDSLVCVGDTLSISTQGYNGRLCAYSNGTNCPPNGWWTGSGHLYLEDTLSATPQFICNQIGIYDLTYHLMDQAGDTAITNLTITVIGDSIYPTIIDTLGIGDSLTLIPNTITYPLSNYEWNGSGINYLSNLTDSTTFIAQDTGIFLLDFNYAFLENCGMLTQPYSLFVTDTTTISALSALSPKQSIKIYPNPATNFVTIENPLLESAVLILYDTQGRTFYSKSLEKASVVDMEVMDWHNGAYFYTIITENGARQTGKLMIVH